jgi:cell division cycle protein 20 (cofactor of APC complex)
MNGGRHIAIGNKDNQIKLYDIELNKKVRTLQAHESKVISLAWNDSILASGDDSGLIV